MRWRKSKTAKWVAEELEGPLRAWLNEGNDQAQRALQFNRAWGIEDADTFSFDQDKERLTFTFPDRVVDTPFQFLGSYNSNSGTWMWAWAIDSIEPRLKIDSLALREVGELRNSPLLTERIVEVSREDADCLALLAVRRSRFDAIYKAPDGPQVSYLSFGSPILP
ncbi:DUF6882 domain-containing protein [Terrabacter sp. Ter38]|uniref:DUF6882 domain-containing protein n=1 Tax=Terrabacter sp. Ter38 TaxID=2926030 RepID=UPI002118DDF4|nr:DUF6882 domain-containing protein [Terrabacter sp. Ter38]